MRKTLFILALSFSLTIQARTTQPVLMDPFDQGAGGSTLTRATQEGMLSSNPALLPYGGKFFKWFGEKTVIISGKDTVSLAKTNAKSSGKGAGSQEALLNTLFTHPIHFGVTESLSCLTNNGGFALFGNVEPDLRIWKRGSMEAGGTPNILLRNESYNGALASLARRFFKDWFSLGITAKYLLVQDTEINVDLMDSNFAKNLQKKLKALKSSSGLNRGEGLDAGMLFFFQGKRVDLRFAGQLANYGNTHLKGKGDLKIIKQTLNAGASITFHNEKDALHLSADMRDIDHAYREAQYKNLVLGARLLLRTYIGFSAGMYDGNPTYGAEIDLIAVRISASLYTREYGISPGFDSRTIYNLGISTGIGF